MCHILFFLEIVGLLAAMRLYIYICVRFGNFRVYHSKDCNTNYHHQGLLSPENIKWSAQKASMKLCRLFIRVHMVLSSCWKILFAPEGVDLCTHCVTLWKKVALQG